MSEIYVSDENVELDPASTWFRKLSEGIVEPIERNVVKDFLETRCHANFTNLTEEHQKGLRAAAYGGKRRPAGMKGVWTEEGWNGIKDWLTGWAELYEQRTGDTLPKIIYRKGEPEEHIVKYPFW